MSRMLNNENSYDDEGYNNILNTPSKDNNDENVIYVVVKLSEAKLPRAPQ